MHKLVVNGGMAMNCSRRCLIRIFGFGIFAIVVLIARNFALMEEAEKSRLALAGSYSGAVEQLADACGSINETLEKQLYANSPEMHKNLAVKLYQQASTAKAALAQLPLERQELQNTYKFLSQVGDYSLSVSRKLGEDSKVSAKDYENISKLYEHSQQLAQDMWELESMVMSGEIDLRQTGVNTSQEKAPLMTDGFADVEESFDGYPKLIYDGPFSDNIMEKKPKMTEGASEVSEKQALERCSIALNMSAGELSRSEKVDGRMPGWRFSDEGGNVSCEVTSAGGYISYFLKGRNVGEEKLSREQAIKSARKYLDYLGILSMKMTYYDIADGVMTINYAYSDLGTCVYTDLVKVSVAMDNGEIVGYDARGFLVNHTKRSYPKKLFSKLRAQEKVSAQLEITGEQLCVIPTDSLGEKLCYEFKCKAKNGRNVLVYINAETGEEQQILLLVETPTGTLTV